MAGINQKTLSRYIPIADFIAEMYGPACEVVIHDITNLRQSIVYITSPNVTGRKIGGPVTDYALELIKDQCHESQNFVVNYLGYASDTQKSLRSSTYFIKEKGELVGLMCVNVDITNLVQAKELIETSMMVDLAQLENKVHQEHFDLSVEGIVQDVLSSYEQQHNTATLSTEDKRIITHQLEKRGIFLVKGAINLVAEMLGVSEQTVYRYLRDTSKVKD